MLKERTFKPIIILGKKYLQDSNGTRYKVYDYKDGAKAVFICGEKTEINTLKISKVAVDPTTTPTGEKEALPTQKYKEGEYVGDTSIIEYAIKKSKHTLLTGPTGCGKTTAIQYLADKAKKRLWTISCAVDTDISEIIGKMTLFKGDTKFVYGSLAQSMKNGDWIVFDEINDAKPDVLSGINAALDHRRELCVKENESEIIKAHKNFRAFATMNPDYEGTIPLNEALRRRFAVTSKINYLPRKQEIKLICDRTNISQDFGTRIVKIGTVLRSMKETDRITKDISTGHLLEFSEAIVAGFNPIDAAKFTLNVSDDKKEMHDIINVVRNHFKE